MAQREAAAERWVDAAEQAAADARLLLEAGRMTGAALLHAEAVSCLLRAVLNDAAARDPAALPRSDPLAARFRAVWLDRPDGFAVLPTTATLRAMADGLRALLPAVRARIAPAPEPEPEPEPAPGPAAPQKPSATRAEPRGPPPAATPASRSQAVAAPPTPAATRAQPQRRLPPPAKPAPRLQTAATPPRHAAKSARPRAEPRRPPSPQPAAPPTPRKPVSSAAFWSLVDRWGVDDAAALALLGHAGGLTKRGTRPRFRLVGAEIERFHLLQTLDDALAALGTDPRAWLRAGTKGGAPLDAMRRGGAAAIRDATRAVVGEGLRRSLG